MKAFLKFFVANFPEKVEKKSDLTDSGKEKDWEQDTEQNLRAQSSSVSHHLSKKGTRSSHLFVLTRVQQYYQIGGLRDKISQIWEKNLVLSEI